MTLEIPPVRPNDWTRLRIIVDKLKHLSLGVNSSPTFAGLTLSAGPLNLSGKLITGAWGSPIDVTATRKYGFELHYSGNNYDVFGIRSRANLITTGAPTRTATGAELQAANTDGIDVNVLCGAKCSSSGKSTSSSATISYMRAVDLITEWGAKDTITNLYNTHIKCITRNSAGEGSFGTGYGIYLENIAVGGTGQALDAGIYFKETSFATSSFIYGIDFTGGSYETGCINLPTTPIIRANGTLFLHSYGTDSLSVGVGSGNVTFTGTGRNYGIGRSCLQSVTTGYSNVGIGFEALKSNEDGYGNIAIAGYQALSVNTSGYYNIGIGCLCLNSNTIGHHNVAIGRGTLENSTEGNYNVGVGFQSLYNNTISGYNIAIGYQSLYTSAAGVYNIGIGHQTGFTDSGEYNVFIGYQAGYYNDTTGHADYGDYNLYLGYQSGYGNSGGATGYRNTGFGAKALFSITTGFYNVAIGYNSLVALTEGNYNMCIGGAAGWKITTSSNNVAIGQNTLYEKTTGNSCIAIGSNALESITTEGNAVAIGSNALRYNITGTVTAIGVEAGYYNILGYYNIFIGQNAGYYAAGSYNTFIGKDAGRGSDTSAPYSACDNSTFIGYQSGYTITTGDRNIFIGHKSGYNQTTLHNLFIVDRGLADNSARASAAAEITDSLIYGIMADAPANQDLRLNAQVGISATPTAALTLPAGTATAGTAPLKFTSGTDLTAPEAGVIEYDGTHFSVTEVIDRRILSVASDSITTAVTVANTVVETTVFTAPISAAELHVGKVLRIWGAGQASTHDASDTLTIRIKIGGTLLTTLDATPGQAANDPLHFWDLITIRTTGAGGTIASHGYIMVKDTEVHDNDQDVAIDTTGANDITVTFQWDDANAGNTATLDQCFLEVLV